jgi:hypothetical protein
MFLFKIDVNNYNSKFCKIINVISWNFLKSVLIVINVQNKITKSKYLMYTNRINKCSEKYPITFMLCVWSSVIYIWLLIWINPKLITHLNPKTPNPQNKPKPINPTPKKPKTPKTSKTPCSSYSIDFEMILNNEYDIQSYEWC